jgi:hypothetical protein
MNNGADIDVSPPHGEAEELWPHDLWQSEWGWEIVVSPGHVYRLSDLKSPVARIDGKLIGTATHRFDYDGGCELGCELMNINATNRGGGIERVAHRSRG